MVSKWIAALVCAAVMVTSVEAQEYLGDDYPPMDDQMPVARGTCQRAAQEAVRMTGGELLSVRPLRNGRPFCAVTVLVINAKGRPRKMRMRVPMDF